MGGCFAILVWIGIGVLQVIHAQGKQSDQKQVARLEKNDNIVTAIKG